MTYKKGSYSKELAEEHKAGRHGKHGDANCPACQQNFKEEFARRLGYPSVEAYEQAGHAFAMEAGAEMDEVLDAHFRGEHADIPPPDNCIHLECIDRDEEITP